MIRLAWRLFGRELRSGELRLLFVALLIAVAAVTAVGFVAERFRLALDREARQLIGGDLVLVADRPWPDAVLAEARGRALQAVPVLSFPSMVQGVSNFQLADIKAVGSAYPLYGKLSVMQAPGQAGQPVGQGPSPGSVWLDERLAAALQAVPGDWIGLGRSRLRVAAILTQEPDRSFNLLSLAPRLLMHIDDVAASGLVQFGSRVTYRWLLGGDPAAVEGFRGWLEKRLERGQRFEDGQNARPEIRSAMDRAQAFLGLATLLTVILSAVATALAARRYLQRHLDACAVMRCLGCSQGALLGLHALLFAMLAAAAWLLGSLLGLVTHAALLAWLARLVPLTLPWPGYQALAQGAAVAFVLLFGFAFPPLLQLSRVPTLRVLRRELGAPAGSAVLASLIGYLALAGLVFAVAGERRLGTLAVAGFSVALLLFWGLARGAIFLLTRWRGTGFGGRQGLASLSRHRSAAVVQIVALAVGLMALMLLTATRGQLLEAWQKSVPPDAPNRFVINIQPEQRQAVQAWLAEGGIHAELSPMVRARLQAIGGRTVSAASYPDDQRAQRLIEREFNLSWRADLPPGNKLTAGTWFVPGQPAQASVEAGLAETLGIRVGDTLVFSVAGQEKTVTVSNLRKLAWDSMQVNFFVLTAPGVIDDAPASYITSFHLPADRAELGRALLERYPGLTMIDVGDLLRQFQSVVTQVVGAVQFIFLFALAAGSVVLYAALLGALDERRHELALLRALGARRRQLLQALLVELAATGAIAGAIAGLGAWAIGLGIARRVFDLSLPFDAFAVGLAALLGAVLSAGVGWLALGRLLRTPPMRVLRAAAG